jgi:hypothetical protein
MTELVIYVTLLWVAENLIGLSRLLETILSLPVSGIAVWVVFECQVAIALFYLLISGVSSHAEHFIVILFLHYL